MAKRKFPTTVTTVGDDDGNINYSVAFDLNQFTGSTLVIGDTVFLSDEGVEVLASTDGNYYAVNAYSFIDSDRKEIGGMYGRDDAGQNVVGFRVIDQAANDDDTVLEIASTSTTDATASIDIQANRSGESTDTYLHLEKSDTASEIDILTNLSSGRVRIGPKINLLGAGYVLCNVYIKGPYFRYAAYTSQ
jgi:hypothetical protein